jgi:hypothetical protein
LWQLSVNDCGLDEPNLLKIPMGMAPGGADQYKAAVAGNNVDITGLAAGDYLLVQRANATGYLRETTWNNNWSSARVRLQVDKSGKWTVRVLATCPDSATCPPSPYADAVLGEPSLRAYWRLGESSGSAARDSAGTRDGTYLPPVGLGVAGALSGDTDTAVALDGTGGRVDVPSLGSSDDFTIEGFERIQSGGAQPSNGNHTLYGLAGRVRLLPRPNGVYAGVWLGGTEYKLQRSTASNVGIWVHWAFVRDGSTLHLYRNGTEVGSLAGLPAGSAAITGSIGRQGTSYSAHADIDEVAVYGGALSQARIQAHLTASGR